MAQQVQLSGTRSPLLWLLTLLILTILGAGIIVFLVWLPQRQVEQHYQAGVAFQTVEEWDMAADAFIAVIELNVDYKDTQSRLLEIKARQDGSQEVGSGASLSVTPVAAQIPTSSPTSPRLVVDGDWELGVHVYRNRYSDASTSSGNSNYTIAIRLTQEDVHITGRYLDASGNACDNADINGEVQGEEVVWTVNYIGACCGGAEMTFRGTLDPTGTKISGALEPNGFPPASCSIWWADVIAIKR